MKITLEETREGCAMFETTPRFNVLMDGAKVGQLYFNMRGYVGLIPFPPRIPGAKPAMVDIGERGLSAFRKEVRQANREWAQYTQGRGRP